jgi:hypothetical protein
MASFFAASGMATYSLFRVGLTLVFRGNPAWDDWWEEFTELIALAALTLFLIEFRGPLGLRFPFLRPGVERSRRP